MPHLRSNRRRPPSILVAGASALAGCVVVSSALAAAAFPGAQGAGAATRGGHGGAIYKVSSLADSGPNTLRACVMADGPRTCIFTKGGIIRLKTPLWVEKPNLTVAGQTAPGGGIVITRAPGFVLSSLVGIVAQNVIWQYTRLRHTYTPACANAAKSECGALLSVHSGGYNVIADHNSLSWNQDEGFGVWNGGNSPIKNITFSMNLIAEGLVSHSTGMITGGNNAAMSANVNDVDFHHNLVMNNSHRNPLLKGAKARVVSNLFYNNASYATQVGGGGIVDIINNVYKKGYMTNVATHEVQAFSSTDPRLDVALGAPSLYLAGNVGWHPATSQGNLTSRVTGENGNENGAIPDDWRRNGPRAVTPPAIAITQHSTAQIAAPAGILVPTVGASRRLSCAGAWVANRDSMDARLISQLNNNTGIRSLPRTEADSGGMPVIAAGVPCADTDNDGLPDEWEKAKFGNLSARPNDDANGDGYTNLEAYLYRL